MAIPSGMFLRKTVWYARKDVPKPLRGIVGVGSLQRRLGTDFKLALIQFYRVMAEFEQRLADARAELTQPQVMLSMRKPDGSETEPKPIRMPDFLKPFMQPTGLKLPAVFQKWAEARQPTTNTVEETRRNMNQFIALNGDLVMPSYRVQHARAWRDLIAAADSAHGTKVKRFAAVTNLFRFGWKNDFIQTNLFEKVSLERPKRVRAARRAEWSLDELRTWFGSPIFTQGYRPKYGEAAFWIVPLGLWHGARLGELCQMDRADVKPDDGIWCMMIRPSDEDDDGPGKSVKTDESVRKVPIHRRLIEAGFLDYVNSLDGSKLFPRVKPDSRGRWSGRVSNWFGEYRRKLGIVERWTDFHALRGTWKTAARGAKLEEEVHDTITGHANGSVGRTYGGIPTIDLKQAVDKVDFDITIPKWQAG